MSAVTGRAFCEPIETAGRRISDIALKVMVDGASGYPFLLQLVGAQTWRLNPIEVEITVEDATLGVTRARRRLGALIHEPALSAASNIDKSFLLAMAHDDGPSKMADIQQRLDVDVNYASQYRLRLIAAELFTPLATATSTSRCPPCGSPCASTPPLMSDLGRPPDDDAS